MAKATIKSQSGAVITVEGTSDEVSKVIATYEKITVVGNAKEVVARATSTKKSERKRETASDLIRNLKKQGFFATPRTLGDIGNALEERGYLYPATSLSGVVLSLLKMGELGRKKKDGKWVYGK